MEIDSPFLDTLDYLNFMRRDQKKIFQDVMEHFLSSLFF
ncbi:hypothetical protein CPK_ORF00575 [Chlamydia pneumoniae LPCoLN]|nr:hypothetical protein CPK_ORF00575 [Chlamydia pneumoniae LPCoLN]